MNSSSGSPVHPLPASASHQKGAASVLKYGYELKDWQAAKDEIVEILGTRVRAGEGTIT